MFGAKVITDKNKIDEILSRGVEEVIDKEHLKDRMKKGEKLRVKLGIDPTSPNIHIGRAVQLWKLKAFQDLGHTAVFIVGDFTGLIGDTSDKDSERPMLTEAQVKSNMVNYFHQAYKILDKKKTEVYFNSEWLEKLSSLEIGKMADLFGLHEFEAREVIARRIKSGKRVSLREILYPIFQGYDSVAVKADVELGGTDQRFNLLAGRTIQPAYNQESQDILMTTLLEGTDGRKMSSSWGNVVNITDEPSDMFGKVMSITDELIIKYFECATLISVEEIKHFEEELKNTSNPRDIKKLLAKEIVALYHGIKAAQEASVEWEKVFSNKEMPSEIQEAPGEGMKLVDFITEHAMATSSSEAKRLLDQGAVSVNEEVVKEWGHMLKKGDIVRVGPRKFLKVV
ncbi:MAG: tyrosine--tRNA ligase [Candidatus Levybacteria bacterium]|nr:tyrosine--tRNA ligase [Candidatus Levybacteria bacterium]